MSVRAKLFTVFGIFTLLFAVAMSVSYTTITELLAAQGVVRAKQINVGDLSRVVANHNEGRVNVLMMLAATDPGEQADWIGRIRNEEIQSDQFIQQLLVRNADSPLFAQRLREHLSLRQPYANVRERVIALALAGKPVEARQLSLGENHARYLKMRDIINDLIVAADSEAAAVLERSKATAAQARYLFMVIGAGVLAASFVGVYVLGRWIANPLQDLLVVAKRVSQGDLRVTVPLTNKADEVGVLAQAFATMLESFRSVHREIQEGVNVLASSASQIFSATAEIAASATQTAAAVSETTSTAVEVKQTAQVSAQKAGNVAEIAQRAAQSAQTGRKAIEDSIAGMQNVREQMEAIAETVVRLSEQSQAIGEIIASVNDLAEQSNLLAVNASIEAAKAGEHGKGFGVVAQEIRNLATQSKESTAQIRSILNDIQRATTATVMAAEQGSKAVDVGVKQVNQSGDAIRALAESIVAAAQAATQITASSQEQLIGIDQVAIAIQNILQASKQNATGMQQAEAGAKSLTLLGQNLKAVAGKFTV
jgi:methyl-accepting chemotaxis protein